MSDNDDNTSFTQPKTTTALSMGEEEEYNVSIDEDNNSNPVVTVNESQDVSSLVSEALSPSDPTDEYLSESENDSNTFLSHNKQYFILSRAGKPIYSMHGNDELVTSYAGVFQTIVSFFDEDKQEDENNVEHLKSFRAGNTLFVVSLEGPLILAAVDKNGQTEAQLKAQLGVLYAQVLSTLTKKQIQKVFETRKNFDLRNLLGGTEVFLKALTKEMNKGSPSILLGALECLRLRKTIREKINNVLIESRTSNLLYGMIVADGRLVSVIRPRRHSLHPPDLYLVFSMLFNTNAFSDGGEHWAPICLPKFNSTGFLYAYINFFDKDTALVLISPDKNAFFELRDAKDQIVEQLNEKDLIDPIHQSIKKGRFKCMDIPAPLIRHFLYKSKTNVQFVQSSFDPHFYEPHAKQRLMNLYHQMHGAAHVKHGGNLKVYNCVRQTITALAWVTPTFEMYCVTGAPTTKDAISQSVRQVVSWIKSQEQRLFVVGGAVF